MINNGLCWLCTLGRLGDLDISQTYIGLEHVLWKAHLAWRRRPIHAASLRQISSIEYNKEKDYVNLGLTLGRGCKRCCRPRRSASVVIFLEQTSNITEEKNTFWSRFTEFLSRQSTLESNLLSPERSCRCWRLCNPYSCCCWFDSRRSRSWNLQKQISWSARRLAGRCIFLAENKTGHFNNNTK